MCSSFAHVLSQALRTIAGENESNQLKEAKQGVTDNSVASSLDYRETEINGKSACRLH